MKSIPTMMQVMTTLPHTIGHDIKLKLAYEMMKEHRVRHLPVQNAGKLVGVLTDRDIRLAVAFQDSDQFQVDEVMTPEPYSVSAQDSLLDVVREMAEQKYGCAIVQDNEKVVGIFTAVDGLRFLGEIMETHLKPRG